jgi:DNA-binding SARP family transcriptional activator
MLRVRLLGKFTVQTDGVDVTGFDGARVQELFAYLLINRGRAHTREALASVFWSESGPDQARKYLRQTLWHLQSALERALPAGGGLLEVTSDWVRLHGDADVWLDIAELEAAAGRAREVSSAGLSAAELEELRGRAAVYSGDLLDGCYQDWCLLERERLQNLYLLLLDKLMEACEVHGQFDAGVDLGGRMLQYDAARERTHRRLMRLHYLGGDRTAALRQYQRCVEALQRELEVAPGTRTQELYAQIRADGVVSAGGHGVATSVPTDGILGHVVRRLLGLQAEVGALARQIEDEVRLTERSTS